MDQLPLLAFCARGSLVLLLYRSLVPGKAWEQGQLYPQRTDIMKEATVITVSWSVEVPCSC